MDKSQAAGAKAPALAPSGNYVCPQCGNHIQVFVKMTHEPSCLQHSAGAVKMELQK